MQFRYILLLLICKSVVSQVVDFDNYFQYERIRINYTVTGNSDTVYITGLGYEKENNWSGPLVNLIDTFNPGPYLIEMHDYNSNTILFSQSYSDLFHEWRTTPQAKLNSRAFEVCKLVPYPKTDAVLTISLRNKDLVFQTLIIDTIRVADIQVHNSDVKDVEFKLLHGNRENMNKSVDLVFISEGYTDSQTDKFYSDVERLGDYLFETAPFNQYTGSFNIYGLFMESEEEGVDVPIDSVYRKTAFNASFGTFGIERYLSVPDISTVYDRLRDLPVDQICILVNSEKYGGGGIFNYYNIFTSDHSSSKFLFIHEFAHGFVGLADEYDVAEPGYNDEVNLSIEPVEPNITTLVNLRSKWGILISDTVPVPTPEIEKYENVIGAFEGGRYREEGIYRSEQNCIMRSASSNRFCKVCECSIVQRIRFIEE